MSLAIIIPAQDNNKYHKKGDLAPFGDITLIEWKITQCKEFVDNTNIFISTNSDEIEQIAIKENINIIKRKENLSYTDMIFNSIKDIESKDIMWINPTSPFMDKKLYENMYNYYKEYKLDSLVSVEKRQEYIFLDGKKLNFTDTFISRQDIEPIYIMTNGCYIIQKDIAIKNKSLISSTPKLFEIDTLSALEIKDMPDYTIAKELISAYFRKDLDV